MKQQTSSSYDRFDSIGKRIRFIRKLSGMSRKEFEEKFHVNLNTLQAWESGKIVPRKKSLEKLLESLKEFHITSSIQWILYGDGSLPIILREPIPQHFPVSLPQDNELSIFKEIDVFEQSNTNNIVIMVNEHSCSNRYQLGDYVGGVKRFGKEISSDVGENCIVGLKDETILIRKLLKSKNNKYTLVPINHDITSDETIHFGVSLKFVARIVWHRTFIPPIS